MQVEVLRSTDQPERLVCQAARGDYYEGYVGDTEYAELMDGIEYKDRHYERAKEELQSGRYPADWEPNREITAKTIAFIEKQLSRGHYGPFEHPQITFAVKGVSRVTMAQITRHRHLTFDIQSMRYADFSDAEPVLPASFRDPDHFSRETGLVDLDEDERRRWRNVYKKMTEKQFKMYNRMVDNGAPKEDARFLLPLGTPVNMTFSGNARTFLHLLDMRRKADAQWEIRELSEMLLDELFEWMPYTFEYYDEHGPNRLSP